MDMKKKTFVSFVWHVGVTLMLIASFAFILTLVAWGADDQEHTLLYLLVSIVCGGVGLYLQNRAEAQEKELKKNPEQKLKVSLSFQTVVLFCGVYALWAIWHLYLLFAAPSDEDSGEYFWFFDSGRSNYALRGYDMSEFCVYVLVPLVVFVVIAKLADIDVKKKE